MGDGFWEIVLRYFMLGVFPWIFVGVGIWQLRTAHAFMQRAVRTTGRVVHVQHERSRSSSNNGSRMVTVYRPTFEYTDPDGRILRAETYMASSGYNFVIGAEREILIDPERGGRVRIPGLMIYGFGAIFTGLGLVFGIAGIVTMIST